MVRNSFAATGAIEWLANFSGDSMRQAMKGRRPVLQRFHGVEKSSFLGR